MFGILYSLFVTVGKGVHDLSNYVQNNKIRNNSINQNKKFYTDTTGRLRQSSDNRVIQRTFKNGHDIYVDSRTNEVVFDNTLDKMNKRLNMSKEEALKKGRTTYVFNDLYYIRNSYNEPAGKWYKDIETEEVFVIRRLIDRKYYYLNIKTGLIERKTDYQIKCDGNNDIDERLLKAQDKYANDKFKSLFYRNAFYNRLGDDLEEKYDRNL